MTILFGDGFDAQGSMGNTMMPITAENLESAAPTIDPGLFEQLGDRAFNTVNQGMNTNRSTASVIANTIAGTGVNLLDNVWASPLSPSSWVGAESGDVWDGVASMGGAEQKQFYAENKELIDGTSGIAGAILTLTIGDKFVMKGASAGMAASTALTATRLWQAGKVGEITTEVLLAQRAALLAGEKYSMLNNAPGLKYLGMKTGLEVGKAARQEALIYGVMWENDAINAESNSEDAFWIAAGLAMGAGAGAIQARASLRKAANSAETKTALAGLFPMAGVSDAMTRAPDSALLHSIREQGRMTEESAVVTQALTAARSNSPLGLDTPARIITQEKSLRNSAMVEARAQMEKIYTRRIEGVEVERLDPKSTPEVSYLLDVAGKNDVGIVHGLAEIGFPLQPFEKSIDARVARLEEIRIEADAMATTKKAAEGRALAAKVARQQKQVPMAFVNGMWVEAKSKIAKAAESFNQKEALRRIIPTDGGAAVKISLPNLQKEVVLDGSLVIRKSTMSSSEIAEGRKSPQRINYHKLQPTDRLYVQEAMRSMISRMTKENAQIEFKLQSRHADDWLALDMADAILEKGGKVDFSATNGMITNQAELQRLSLRAKANKALEELMTTGEITDEFRLKYNLPAATSIERLEDPTGIAFRSWLQGAATDLGTAHELGEALAKNRAMAGVDLMPVNKGKGVPLHGDMLNWNRNEQGVFMRPQLGYFNPSSTLEKLSMRGAEERAAIRTAESVATLVNRTKNHFTNRLSRMLLASPEIVEARKVTQLNSAQSTGLANKVAQAISEILPRRFLHRDNPIILAASRMFEQATRFADMEFRDMMKATGMQEVVTKMTTPRFAALAAELDSFASLRPGWDIAEAIEVEPGWHMFQLSDTVNNRRLLGVEKIQDGDFMPNMRIGKPIAVSTEALSAIERFNQMSNELLDGANEIRKARGATKIAHKQWFMPTPDTRGKLVGFLFDENGNMVPFNTIVADSEAEYAQLMKRTLEESPTGYSISERKQLEATKSEWDKQQMDWVDHGGSSATMGKGQQSGGLTGAFVKQGAFHESLQWVHKQVQSQARDTLSTMMHDPIRMAKMRSTAERFADASAGRTIFDEWEQALTGASGKFKETSILAKGVEGFEDSIDKILASSAVHMPVSHVMDMARRFGVSPSELSKKRTYRQILETMGDYSPFKDQADYLESQGISMPPSVKAGARKLNALATNLVLRWDPAAAHATMNMLGLIPTIVAGVAAGSSPSTLKLSVRGRTVPMIDSMQIIKKGIKDMTSKSSSADYAFMVKNGDATQSAFEYHQTIGAIESQAGYLKWMKDIDKKLAWASEGSENLSRQIGMFTGLRLADYQGIKGMDARHAFAREFANAAIADYTPSNRPELFQTALGSVFGLFQSYVVNQYTKMFHWIEDGQYAAAGTQAAVQASLFGLQGTYGIGALLDMHTQFTGQTGEPDIIDAAYRRFGPVAGGALMHGGFGELTQIALWTRGDTNIRVPVISGGMPAGIDVMNRLTKIMTGTIEAALEEGPIDAMPAIIENLQREMPNRMLKGILAVTALGGQETDRYGSVMTDTQDWVDRIVRLAGVRSRRTQQELETFYRNKSDVDRDTARMDTVRTRLKTDLRTALRTNGTVDPVLYFDDYVASGGNPNKFRTWMRRIAADATNPRAAQQLKKGLESPRNGLALWRYGATGAWGIDDGTTAINPNQ